MAAPSEPLELAAGDLRAGLVPAIGGSIAHFRWRGIDLMRALSATDAQAGNVLGVACFPMLPYANRITGNAFTFEGRTWRFAANNPPERFNVHGTGWQRAWSADRAGPGEAHVTLEVSGGGEPFAYRAAQRFSLSADALTVTITLTTLGEMRAPIGFGLHPWFERDADTTLQFAAKRFYLEAPDHVAGDPVALSPEWDFTAARLLPGSWLNNDYGDWDGSAAIRYPSRGAGLRITADAVFKHLMVYADPTKSCFCAEPQTNASGAFNRQHGFDDPREGIIVLAPGASAEGSIRFAPFGM